MEDLLKQYWWLAVMTAVWAIPWKMAALYKAGKNQSKGWFVALFFINTLGLLEIVYIFLFDNKKSKSAKKPKK